MQDKFKNTMQSKFGVDNPMTSEEIKSKRKKTYKKDLEKRLLKISSDKYTFNINTFVNYDTEIECKGETHGVFYKTPKILLAGAGCPICSRLYMDKNKFILKSKIIHNDYYNYDNVKYINYLTPVEIKCPKHGIFLQKPSHHLLGHGCRKCNTINTKPENSVKDFIESLGVNYIENDRLLLNGLELDIYIPEKKIAIEYNGLYWHSELFKNTNYHNIKTNQCIKQGVKLIHIFGDEWEYKQSIVKSRIKNFLGLTINKIYARKCEIKKVTTKDSKLFLEENHLQGHTQSSIKIGLYYKNELVSLMTFSKPRLGIGVLFDGYELTRFVNKLDTNIIGGASKLLKYFIKTYKPKEIVSYADRRWSDGNIYKILGFDEISINKPNYWYVINGHRKHRFGFRKSILKKQGYDTKNKTEHQIMLENKIYRIYDSGTITYKKTLT
jgi:hypothetical protein